MARLHEPPHVRETGIRGEHERHRDGCAGRNEHDEERFVFEPQVAGAELCGETSEDAHRPWTICLPLM